MSVGVRIGSLRFFNDRPGTHPVHDTTPNQKRHLPSVLHCVLLVESSLPHGLVTCGPLVGRCATKPDGVGFIF